MIMMMIVSLSWMWKCPVIPPVYSVFLSVQYSTSPGNRAYCYAELAVSFLAIALTIASTHFACGGMTRLSWPGWLG